MANSNIDLFPFLKQRKASISSVHPCKGKLMIVAEFGHGLSQNTVKAHSHFEREIKEDI